MEDEEVGTLHSHELVTGVVVTGEGGEEAGETMRLRREGSEVDRCAMCGEREGGRRIVEEQQAWGRRAR